MWWVYFIRSGQPGRPIKVGHAKDVDKRVQELQIGNPDKLVLMGTIKVVSKAAAHGLEKKIHRYFNHKHIRGEWFKGSIELCKVETQYQRMMKDAESKLDAQARDQEEDLTTL